MNKFSFFYFKDEEILVNNVTVYIDYWKKLLNFAIKLSLEVFLKIKKFVYIFESIFLNNLNLVKTFKMT